MAIVITVVNSAAEVNLSKGVETFAKGQFFNFIFYACIESQVVEKVRGRFFFNFITVRVEAIAV